MIYYYLYVGECPINIYKSKNSALKKALKMHKSRGLHYFTIYKYSELERLPLKIEKITIENCEVFYR